MIFIHKESGKILLLEIGELTIGFAFNSSSMKLLFKDGDHACFLNDYDIKNWGIEYSFIGFL
jgi:hypothetical protein